MKKSFPNQLKLDENYSKRLQIKERNEVADFPLHWHDYYEMEICIDGSAVHKINGKEYSFKKGDFLIIKTSDFHEVKIESAITYYNISFSPTAIEPKLLALLMEKRNFTSGKLKNDDFLAVTTILKNASKNGFANKELNDIVQLSAVNMTIATALRYAPISTSEQENTLLQQSINYIHTNFMQNPSLYSVAQMSGFQVNYFCRKFKQATGKTYLQYLSEVKIEHAKNLLASSLLSVTEVCYECGFSSLSHFLREFRKKTNFTPTEYRNLQKGE